MSTTSYAIRVLFDDLSAKIVGRGILERTSAGFAARQTLEHHLQIDGKYLREVQVVNERTGRIVYRKAWSL